MPQDWTPEVRRQLEPLADAERAAAMAAYMRHRFAFFGIPTPVRRQAVRPWLRAPQTAAELLAHAGQLWAMAERECQYVAVDLLARQVKRLGPENLPALLALVREKSWWDSVDGLAGVIGDLLRPLPPAEAGAAMAAALRDDSLWVRRVAMLHQLGWREATDSRRLFDYARQLAGEPDFFIRKAIGWALRDYARHAPLAVRDFLLGEGRSLSTLSKREAGKHLSPRV